MKETITQYCNHDFVIKYGGYECQNCGVEHDEINNNSLQDEINYWYEKTGSLTSEDIVKRAYSLGITEGYKLAKEGMYSEEEVRLILRELSEDLYDIYPLESLEQWFENFKKK